LGFVFVFLLRERGIGIWEKRMEEKREEKQKKKRDVC
jgi:hypothetical protein